MNMNKEASMLGTEHLPLDGLGVDECMNSTLGALDYLVRHVIQCLEDLDDPRTIDINYPLWMICDQIDQIDSYLERLSKAMLRDKIRLEEPAEEEVVA